MEVDEYEARGLESWAPAFCAVLAIVLGLAFVLGGQNFCLDDAWIHLSYAKSLSAGDGLSYNPGDWETGFSSPLWVLCLALWPTDANPVVSVKLLGLLFHAASAWLACSLVLELGHRRATVKEPQPLASMGLLAGVLVATQVSALRGATSGMEVSLCAALCLGVALTTLRERWAAAALFSALAVWARPEAMAFVGSLGAGIFLLKKERGPVLLVAGGGAAFAGWMIYCQVVSGYPLPNTFYVKTAGEGDSLAYLSQEVLAAEAWLISLGGVLLLGAAVRKEQRQGRPFALILIIAWAASMLAIALSRPLHPGVLFFEARYFFFLSGIPLVLVALGLPDLPPWLAGLCLIPVLSLNGWFSLDSHERMRAQELSVTLLHTNPAGDLDKLAGATARVFVEGAGATRYFGSRERTVIDALGLNRGSVAHAATDPEKACVLVNAHPDYALLPDHIAAPLARVFVWTSVRSYLDPDNAIVRVRHPMRVQLYRIDEVRPAWKERCSSQ